MQTSGTVPVVWDLPWSARVDRNRTSFAAASANRSRTTSVAPGGEFGIGTGTFHQSATCAAIQFSGDRPAQLAFGNCAPAQLTGSVQPTSTFVHVLPWSVDSSVPCVVTTYHQVPYKQPAICADRNCPC